MLHQARPLTCPSPCLLSFPTHPPTLSQAWDLISTCNGCLVGFVVVTAGCHVLEPWAAFGGCFVGGWIFDAVCVLFLKLKIDDPLSAAPMHGFTGMWGVILVGLLAKREFIFQSYNGSLDGYLAGEFYGKAAQPDATLFCGCFYPGCGGRLLAAQVRWAGALGWWG